MDFHSIPEAIAELKKGRPIVVVDDKNRENEGDVVFAASKSTPAKINFLAKHARGLICVALSAERTEKLRLRPMTEQNGSRHETAFTISVEAREGTTTGISAADRSLTAKLLADESAGPGAFISPGHTFPIRARQGGVLVRAGHTEAAVDLVQMAGLGCAGVICEIMNEDGSMARLPDCRAFAKRHGLKIISVADLIHHRHTREKQVRAAGVFNLPTIHGDFTVHAFEDLIHGKLHLALVRGDISSSRIVPVRVHSEFLLGDVFGAKRGNAGDLLQQGLRIIAREGGVFLYMRQIHSEEVLGRTLEKYAAEDARRVRSKPRQAESASMDARTYGIGAQILFELGIRRLNLLTNHPKRIQGLEGYGLRIARQMPFPGAGAVRPKKARVKATGKEKV
jgi:3,4-dihydroxy 2-butanone 4-phosphate synthase/GTP cyclohydrolase II